MFKKGVYRDDPVPSFSRAVRVSETRAGREMRSGDLAIADTALNAVEVSGTGSFCRICYDGDPDQALISPCNCTGTVGLVHAKCLSRWVTASRRTKCELCSADYRISRTLTNPATWMKGCRIETLEDRKCIQCVSCHLVVSVCFMWSLVAGIRDIVQSDDVFSLFVKLFICCVSGVSAVVIFVTGGKESYVHWTKKVVCAVSTVNVILEASVTP